MLWVPAGGQYTTNTPAQSSGTLTVSSRLYKYATRRVYPDSESRRSACPWRQRAQFLSDYCDPNSARLWQLAATELDQALRVLLRRRGLSPAAIARVLGWHRSTIVREVWRNHAASDGTYRPQLASWYGRGRGARSRRNPGFTAAELQQVRVLLEQQRSPEQVAGYLRRHGLLRISHETIYCYIRLGYRTRRNAKVIMLIVALQS